MASLAFFLMVLHISAYSICCLLSPVPPFLVVSSSGFVLVLILSISVACYVCDGFAHGVDAV